MTAVALIPARSGSERVPGKNVRLLAGRPLLAYSIAAAQQSECFSEVFVSTDSSEYARVAQHYGAAVFMRPQLYAGALSPDIDWVRHAIEGPLWEDWQPDLFAILRPTSPFRTADTIKRAFEEFDSARNDSLRAVEPVKQHPGKMWILRDDIMYPLMPMDAGGPPMHSSQYKSLPQIYVQNSSLELADTRKTLWDTHSIAGYRIQPFITNEFEGFAIDTPADWQRAEYILAEGLAPLPEVP